MPLDCWRLVMHFQGVNGWGGVHALHVGCLERALQPQVTNSDLSAPFGSGLFLCVFSTLTKNCGCHSSPSQLVFKSKII